MAVRSLASVRALIVAIVARRLRVDPAAGSRSGGSERGDSAGGQRAPRSRSTGQCQHRTDDEPARPERGRRHADGRGGGLGVRALRRRRGRRRHARLQRDHRTGALPGKRRRRWWRRLRRLSLPGQRRRGARGGDGGGARARSRPRRRAGERDRRGAQAPGRAPRADRVAGEGERYRGGGAPGFDQRREPRRPRRSAHRAEGPGRSRAARRDLRRIPRDRAEGPVGQLARDDGREALAGCGSRRQARGAALLRRQERSDRPQGAGPGLRRRDRHLRELRGRRAGRAPARPGQQPQGRRLGDLLRGA